MQGRDYLSFLNMAGAVSSILALLLTLSQNATFSIALKVFVAIVFFVASAGVFGAGAYYLRRIWIKSTYWPFLLLFWLVSGMLICFISALVAAVSYFAVDSLIYLFKSAVENIN